MGRTNKTARLAEAGGKSCPKGSTCQRSDREISAPSCPGDAFQDVLDAHIEEGRPRAPRRPSPCGQDRSGCPLRTRRKGRSLGALRRCRARGVRTDHRHDGGPRSLCSAGEVGAKKPEPPSAHLRPASLPVVLLIGRQQGCRWIRRPVRGSALRGPSARGAAGRRREILTRAWERMEMLEGRARRFEGSWRRATAVG